MDWKWELNEVLTYHPNLDESQPFKPYCHWRIAAFCSVSSTIRRYFSLMNDALAHCIVINECSLHLTIIMLILEYNQREMHTAPSEQDWSSDKGILQLTAGCQENQNWTFFKLLAALLRASICSQPFCVHMRRGPYDDQPQQNYENLGGVGLFGSNLSTLQLCKPLYVLLLYETFTGCE